MYKYTLANFEIIGWKSWTCEESWEDHKDRNGDSSAHISVCYLYVLNLCGCKTTPVHFQKLYMFLEKTAFMKLYKIQILILTIFSISFCTPTSFDSY